MTEKIRVRYAPSPTGHLHIGNARTAIFNWLFARHYQGQFVIRIEDTDLARNVAGGEKSQLDNLKWLGVDWDEGPDKPNPEYAPYRQTERAKLGIYDRYIQELLDQGKAYKSYKTEETLKAEREAQAAAHQAPHYVYEYAGMDADQIKAAQVKDEAAGLKAVVRFRVPEDHDYQWQDIVKGKVKINSKEIGGDWVIQKADGMPTYNFAVVIDDHLMEITHVLRGDDHVSNTPKQLMVYDALGWQAPKFGHMALIIKAETGKKLSKRDEDTLQFIEQYRELGYLPEAMFNFIGLLGWSPVGENEIFTREQFKDMFDETRFTKANAKFDAKKLAWVNNQWMRAEKDRVMPQLIAELVKAGLISQQEADQQADHLAKIIEIAGVDGIKATSEIAPLATYPFFKLHDISDEDKAAWLDTEAGKQVTSAFAKAAAALTADDFTAENLMKLIRQLQTDLAIKGRPLWNPIRLITTHEVQGPNLPEILAVMGRDWTLKNIQETLV
ncbi:glutamate--tRNA ligase [Oenococcus sp.]|uniref:glutamate--tRNA ligase n=1 Tax=Oenococcus sp. TaxID=1979414 RepID=UPI0039EC0326